MNIIIHIGWHKTGTTSVQQFLLKNRLRLIEENNIYYPEEGLLHCAHHNIAWILQGKKMTPWGEVLPIKGGAEGYLVNVIENAKLNNCNTIIFSSEEFCIFRLQEIQALYKALHQHINTVKIIAYIRRQDLIVESAYNMEIKWWGVRASLGFDQYIKNKEGYPDYYATLLNWGNTFGFKSLIIRPFEKKLFYQNDVRIDFCSQLGVDYSNLELEKELSNESLGPNSLEFLRILNSLAISKEMHELIVSKLLEYDKKNQSPNCVLFEPEQRVNFMNPSNDSNKKLEKFGLNVNSFMLNFENIPKSNASKLTLAEFMGLLRYVTSSHP